MAEIAATAIGIAGVVGVLQSLFTVYKGLQVALEFDSDVKTRLLEIELLQQSMKTWGLTVGFIDKTGAVQHRVVSKLTKEDFQHIGGQLRQIFELFEKVNTALDRYRRIASETSNKAMNIQRAKEERKIWGRLRLRTRRIKSRSYEQQHPNIILRGKWAHSDKENIDEWIRHIKLIHDLLKENSPSIPKSRLSVTRIVSKVRRSQFTDEMLADFKRLDGPRPGGMKLFADTTVMEIMQ